MANRYSRLSNKILLTHQKYIAAIDALKSKIFEKVEFEFDIVHQMSDGFCLLHVEKTSLAPLYYCLEIIENQGKLNEEDHYKYSI